MGALVGPDVALLQKKNPGTASTRVGQRWCKIIIIIIAPSRNMTKDKYVKLLKSTEEKWTQRNKNI